MLKVGSMVKLSIIGKENECYNDFKNKILIITKISTNEKEHPGYDSSMRGMPLYDFIDLDGNYIPCSLYKYEIIQI